MLIEIKDFETIGKVIDFAVENDLLGKIDFIKLYSESIEITIDSYEIICCACPTIYAFSDTKSTKEYIFRLRFGEWSLQQGDDIIAEGVTNKGEFDGNCTWDEAVNYMKEKGVVIKQKQNSK